MKCISAIHPAITENAEDLLVKCAPQISMHESHNALILTMLNPFHSIMSVRIVSAIFVPRTEAITL